jgi:protein LSM14
VQVFGTEDRVTDKSKTVLPSTQILPFVTFPGLEIKDLYVHESSTPPAAPAHSTTAPPAPPKAEKKAHNNHQQQHASKPASNTSQHNYSRPQQHQNQYHQKREEKPRAAAVGAEPAVKREAAKPSEVGTGGHLLKMRERKNGPGGTAAPVETNTEFDFEEGLKTFKKDEVLAEVAGDKEITKYTKDDFFDNFSKTTAGETKARLSAADERKLNQDTFGAIALQSGYRRGGRGGGRGRGRGRGYGGRGRGGQSSTGANA